MADINIYWYNFKTYFCSNNEQPLTMQVLSGFLNGMPT